MQRERIGDLCIGRWRSILTSLGVDDGRLVPKHGPCPACGGKDRFRFDNKEGRGTWYCSHCGAGDGIDLLRKINGWSFVQAAREVERVLGVSSQDEVRKEQTDEQKRDALNRVWRESKPVVTGDLVWMYLNGRTGIETVSPSIRFHPKLRYDKDRSFPAMVAMVTMPDGTRTTLHRTWLDGKGGKAPVDEPKKVMAGTIKTGSIRLTDVQDCIGIAEGIETALSVQVRFEVPTWAAISAGGVRDWIPPAGIKHVMVFGDNDANYTGHSAAYSLANRLELKGVKTEVFFPAEVGKDFADD